MNYDYIIGELTANQNVFQSLLQHVSAGCYEWQPEPGKWSLLEILCHLYDEEREDFRARLKHILATPNDPLPSIDPVGWVTARQYITQDYDTVLNNFLTERKKSVTWLRSLSGPAWKNYYQHPKLGPLSAEMMLANWLAHDYLHIRQITRTKYYYLMAHSNVDLNYAGNW